MSNITRIFLSDIEYMGGSFTWIQEGKSARVLLGKFFYVNVLPVGADYRIISVKNGDSRDFYEMVDLFLDESASNYGFFLFYRQLWFTIAWIVLSVSFGLFGYFLYKAILTLKLIYFILVIIGICLITLGLIVHEKALKIDFKYFKEVIEPSIQQK